MHHPFNEDLEVVLQTSEAWDILQGIGGWFDGACLLLACALQRCLGFGQIQNAEKNWRREKESLEQRLAAAESRIAELVSGIKEAQIELIETGNCYEILEKLIEGE